MPRQRSSRPAVDPAELIRDVQAVLDRLQIRQWDVLIAGDGSGTGWKDACGWSHIVVDRISRERELFRGACDGSSINLAEMMPTLHGLTWYHNKHGRGHLHRLGTLHVHIITDSKVTTEHGALAVDLNAALPAANLLFWSGVREFKRKGYQIQFHWLERLTTEWNQCADLVASLSRRVVKQTDLWRPDSSLLQKLKQQFDRGCAALEGQGTIREGLIEVVSALGILLDRLGTPAELTARGLEGVQLIDPATQQPIDLQTITPDANPTS